MKLFGRAWRIQVGPFDASELDCKFTIKRGLGGRAGSCELEVYNLWQDHRDELHATSGGTYVQVDAGYQEGTSMLFRGTFRRINILREKTDWVAKITAGDGEFGARAARVSRAFPAGTALTPVVQAIATAMGVGMGNAAEALREVRFADASADFPGGTVVHGLASRELGTICDGLGLEWSIQDGSLLLLPLGGALQRDAIVLSPDTGLLDSPEVGKKHKLKARCLIIPGITPGAKVQVVSAGTNGIYRIEKAEYVGETRGTDWTVTLDLSAWPPPTPAALPASTPEAG